MPEEKPVEPQVPVPEPPDEEPTALPTPHEIGDENAQPG
jgi:hypothetical protein